MGGAAPPAARLAEDEDTLGFSVSPMPYMSSPPPPLQPAIAEPPQPDVDDGAGLGLAVAAGAVAAGAVAAGVMAAPGHGSQASGAVAAPASGHVSLAVSKFESAIAQATPSPSSEPNKPSGKPASRMITPSRIPAPPSQVAGTQNP